MPGRPVRYLVNMHYLLLMNNNLKYFFRKLYHLSLVANLSSRSHHLYDYSPGYVRLSTHANRSTVPSVHVWRQPDAHLQHQHNQEPFAAFLVVVCF